MSSSVKADQHKGLFRQFIEWNCRTSLSLMPRAFKDGEGAAYYNKMVRQAISRDRPAVVVDVGAGGNCWYVDDALRKEVPFKLIGQDVDGAELALNKSIDDSVVCDASVSVGVPDGTADMVVSHFAIEHIPNNAGFLAASNRALKMGGRVVFVFQGKWAPSSILNRMIPPKLTQRLLLALVPGSDGVLGFEAHYDKCSHSEFKAELERQGFEVEQDYCSYYNSNYFAFFVPLYVASLGLDYVRLLIGNRNLATQCVFVARKVR